MIMLPPFIMICCIGLIWSMGVPAILLDRFPLAEAQQHWYWMQMGLSVLTMVLAFLCSALLMVRAIWPEVFPLRRP